MRAKPMIKRRLSNLDPVPHHRSRQPQLPMILPLQNQHRPLIGRLRLRRRARSQSRRRPLHGRHFPRWLGSANRVQRSE